MGLGEAQLSGSPAHRCRSDARQTEPAGIGVVMHQALGHDVHFAVIEEERRSRETHERPAENRLFDVAEHQRVVDEPFAALHVRQSCTGMSSPRRRDRSVDKRRPMIHRDGTVPQLVDRSLESTTNHRIIFEYAMTNDRGGEGSPQRVVAELRRRFEEFDGVIRTDGDFADQSTKRLRREQRFVLTQRIEMLDQGPR